MNTTPPLPPATPPPATPPPAAPAPASGGGGSKILIIILCIVIGFFVLIGGCVATCAWYAHKKAKEYTEAAHRNPQLTALSTMAAFTPGVQVVSKDEKTGKITLRNKNTGETVTINANDYTTDNVANALEKFVQGGKFPSSTTPPASAPANDDSSNSAPSNTDNASSTSSAPAADQPEPKITTARASALSSAAKKLPNFVNTYPGSQTTDVTQNTIAGMSMGTYEFNTTDKPDDILDFYEKKITGAGFTVVGKNSETNDFGPVGHLVATRGEPMGNLNVEAASRAHDVHVTISFVQH